MEQVFYCNIRAMGGKLVLLEGSDSEDLKALVEMGQDWLGQWFEDIRPWSPTMVATEHFAWIHCKDEDDVDVEDIVAEVAKTIGEVVGEVDDKVEDTTDEMAKTTSGMSNGLNEAKSTRKASIRTIKEAKKIGINVEEEVQSSNLNSLKLGVAVKIADTCAAKNSDEEIPVAFMINGIGSENHALCMATKGGNEVDLNGDGYSLIGDGRKEIDSIKDLKMAAISMQANEELLDGVGFTCLRLDDEKVFEPEGENVEGGSNHVWVSKVRGPMENGPPISIGCTNSNLLGQPQFKPNQEDLRSFWEGLESELGEVAEWMRKREHKVKRKQRRIVKSCASIYKEIGGLEDNMVHKRKKGCRLKFATQKQMLTLEPNSEISMVDVSINDNNI
ncbi:hypothetical protein SLEP1_g27795 [Rubroshorea leprosula]|uniref:Uncharacterized protein n=1 Tax=Rubroshorea leprosula TaxID=152421 RepID=A0AAV5K0W6_9ROSI|nr:hypothetical protein SLEP1_g27795 [Rubroshorea leprosula]